MSAQDDLLRRVASVIGHELRNPLAVINNSAYFVKAKLGESADPKVAKHLGIIASEIARADKMIADMLAYSRPLELKLKPESLNALVEKAIAETSWPAAVKVQKKLAASAAAVKVDAAAIVSALRRVLDNAAEACAEGGVVSVITAQKGAWASVVVADGGKGIDAKDLPKIFEPFFTTKPRGLGLGLSIAAKIMAAHGGRLEAADVTGGAALTFSIPA